MKEFSNVKKIIPYTSTLDGSGNGPMGSTYANQGEQALQRCAACHGDKAYCPFHTGRTAPTSTKPVYSPSKFPAMTKTQAHHGLFQHFGNKGAVAHQ